MMTITNEDNMELMARYPDKYFDLAIVDPPYGIGHSIRAGNQSGERYVKLLLKKQTIQQKIGIYLHQIIVILMS